MCMVTFSNFTALIRTTKLNGEDLTGNNDEFIKNEIMKTKCEKYLLFFYLRQITIHKKKN